jgi:CBS domain containing-hemolysin-like protein
VAGFVQESHREGLLSEDKEHLLRGALRFDERTVRSVLLPMDTLVVVSPSATPSEIEALAVQTGFSRFPVRNPQGALVGYVHLKDALAVEPNRRQRPIDTALLRKLTVVRAQDSLRSALTTMQRSGTHLAVVVGPRKRTLGIVALEDMLEELVGEIADVAHARA